MLTKFAAAKVLDARVAQRGGVLMKDAHRHDFKYDPRPGYLYVRSRAISSRTNDNYDHFPAEEIKKAYKTFIGKPVFVNHHNDNHRRARGVIVDAALHEDRNPDGSPDTWVEVLMEVDAVRFPKLAQAILAGHIDRTSMGTDVEFSVCSVCNNRAETPLDYCQHIPKMKGMKVRRRTASGGTEEVLVYEKCYGLRFFENSLLVEEPADPTAYFLGVDDRGLQVAASRREGYPVTSSKVEWQNASDIFGAELAAKVGDLTLAVYAKAGGLGWSIEREGQEVAEGSASNWDDARARAEAAASKLAKTAYGEVKVPAQVDTLRDENCPICGESDSYDGNRCMVCQYVKPPDEFMDPDLEKAKEVDLRQKQDAEEVAKLQCDNCGAEYDASTDPETVKTHRAAHKVAKPKGNPFAKGEDEDDSNPFVEEDDAESPESEDTGQYKAGDICPNCGEGTLQAITSSPATEVSPPVEDGESDEDSPEDSDGEDGKVEGENPFAKDEDSDGSLPSDSEEEDSEESEDSDDEDEDKPHGLKFKKKQSSHNTGGIPMSPALEALAKTQDTIDAQNKRIAALTEGLRFIAQAAGLESHPKVAALIKSAEDENPAQPKGWANPGGGGEEAPKATSEETLGFDNESQEPALPDDPRELGAASKSDTSPDAQTSVESTDTVLDDGLDLNEVDVTAPVSGTDDLGEGPRGQAGSGRTETEVRVGDPNNPQPAFAETGWTEASKDPSEVRTFAALRLARLRIQAGIEEGDDLALSARIAADESMSDQAIQAEIATLDRVVTAQAKSKTRVPRNLVPRSASVERTTPSFQAPVQKVAVGPDADEFLFE